MACLLEGYIAVSIRRPLNRTKREINCGAESKVRKGHFRKDEFMHLVSIGGSHQPENTIDAKSVFLYVNMAGDIAYSEQSTYCQHLE